MWMHTGTGPEAAPERKRNEGNRLVSPRNSIEETSGVLRVESYVDSCRSGPTGRRPGSREEEGELQEGGRMTERRELQEVGKATGKKGSCKEREEPEGGGRAAGKRE